MDFNLTIKNKLIASFAIVIIGVLFLGFKSVTEMNMLSGLTAKMYKHPLTVTKASLEADTAIIIIHRSMKDVALAQNKQAMAKAVAAVDQYEQVVFDKLAIVQEFILGKEGEQLIAQTINTFKNWKPIRQEVIDFMKAGDRQAASAITKEKGAAHVQKIAEKMKALTDYAAVKATGFNNNAKSIYDDAVMVMLVIIALLCVIGLVVAVILIKHITQPLNELQRTIESIEKSSDLTQSVKIYRDDEFGSIANRFNAMINTFKLAITQVATSSTEVAQAAGHTSTLNSHTRDS